MLAEDNDDEDEKRLTQTEVDSYETIQIQGSDRRFPAIVRRASFAIDKSRTTIQTISRQDRRGRINPLYDDYIKDIKAYNKRRRNATRGNRKVGTIGAGTEWTGLSSVGEKKERGKDMSGSEYMDPGFKAPVMLAKGPDDEGLPT